MMIKKYEAESLEKALALVKSELGPAALILSTHQKKGKWFHKPLVEVTAGFDREPSGEATDVFDEEELR